MKNRPLLMQISVSPIFQERSTSQILTIYVLIDPVHSRSIIRDPDSLYTGACGFLEFVFMLTVY